MKERERERESERESERERERKKRQAELGPFSSSLSLSSPLSFSPFSCISPSPQTPVFLLSFLLNVTTLCGRYGGEINHFCIFNRFYVGVNEGEGGEREEREK